MHRIIVTIVLLIGLCYSLVVLASGMAGWRLPDNQRGYSPSQPISYSHRLHAGELGIEAGDGGGEGGKGARAAGARGAFHQQEVLDAEQRIGGLVQMCLAGAGHQIPPAALTGLEEPRRLTACQTSEPTGCQQR